MRLRLPFFITLFIITNLLLFHSVSIVSADWFQTVAGNVYAGGNLKASGPGNPNSIGANYFSEDRPTVFGQPGDSGIIYWIGGNDLEIGTSYSRTNSSWVVDLGTSNPLL